MKGGKKKMYVVQLCFLALCTIETACGSISLPIFDADVMKTNKSTLLQFKCSIFKRPIDNILHFLVNSKSVILMDFANKTCYNKANECTKDLCRCSYKDFSFTWVYPVNSSSIDSTFGVALKIATEQNEEFGKITLSGTYYKSVFKVNQSIFEETQKENTNPDELKNLKRSNEVLIAIIAVTVGLEALLFTTCCICKRRKKYVKQPCSESVTIKL